MAYLVARPDGRYEIRESRRGKSGPIARSLSTFKILDRSSLDRARANCRGKFDQDQIVKRAKELGVPTQLVGDATELALNLVAEIRSGAALAPGVAAVVREALPETPAIDPGIAEAVAEWAGRSDRDRGDALLELMLLAEQYPDAERKGDIDFPPFRHVA